MISSSCFRSAVSVASLASFVSFASFVSLASLAGACGGGSTTNLNDQNDKDAGGSGTGSSHGGGPDATSGGSGSGSGSSDGGGFAKLPSPPQVVDSNPDGGVIPSASFIAVFFSNDDQSLVPTLEQIYSGMGSSAMWAAGAEYGVGAATATNIILTQAAPATIDDSQNEQGTNTALQTWLLNAISTNLLPAPNGSNIYMLNYPTTTTVTANGNQCTDFDGYHEDLQTADGTVFAYGVVPRCTDPGSTPLVTFSSTVSHEMIEAATDPYPDYNAGWSQADNAHLFFDEANDGSEVADMCENDPEAYAVFAGFPFTVQRIWSNAQALAGHDPCVPELPNTVFFNSVPELPNTGLFDYYGSTLDVASVHIPVGGTATVYLDLYSDGVTPDWDVFVQDLNEFDGGDPSANLLTITMPGATSGNNGSRIPVTITVKTAGNPMTNGQVANTEIFGIISSQGTSDTSPAHYWYGIVTN